MMWFLLILVFVFVGVDLFVRFVIEPLLEASDKKSKVSKSFAPRFDPTIKLATATMFDGGKPHDEEETNNVTKVDNNSKDASESSKQ